MQLQTQSVSPNVHQATPKNRNEIVAERCVQAVQQLQPGTLAATPAASVCRTSHRLTGARCGSSAVDSDRRVRAVHRLTLLSGISTPELRRRNCCLIQPCCDSASSSYHCNGRLGSLRWQHLKGRAVSSLLPCRGVAAQAISGTCVGRNAMPVLRQSTVWLIFRRALGGRHLLLPAQQRSCWSSSRIKKRAAGYIMSGFNRHTCSMQH